MGRLIITAKRPEDAANAKVLQAVLNKQWEDMGGDEMALREIFPLVTAMLMGTDKIDYEPK